MINVNPNNQIGYVQATGLVWNGYEFVSIARYNFQRENDMPQLPIIMVDSASGPKVDNNYLLKDEAHPETVLDIIEEIANSKNVETPLFAPWNLYDTFVQAFDHIEYEVNTNAKVKGFWDGPQNQAEKIALMHSELSEALEAIRNAGPSGECFADKHVPECSNLEVELADTIIRIMDFSKQYNLNVAKAIVLKHAFNKTRPHKHGKNF